MKMKTSSDLYGKNGIYWKLWFLFYFSGPQVVITKGHAINIRIAIAITCSRDVSACAVVLKIVRKHPLTSIQNVPP